MDLRIVETFDGGDAVLKGNDLEIVSGFQNMPYIGLFGGNIEESTRTYNEGEQRFDFWGNTLFHDQDSKIQFNSDTERILAQVALSSSGRLLIEQAVKRDLSFMGDFSSVTSSVSIIDNNRIKIHIIIQEPENVQSNEFTYIWDSTEQELELINT